MIVGKRIYYSGRVQGVGFRYTAQRLAAGFRVAGSVRNLADGTVELIVEGEPDQVDGFRTALERQMAGYVEEIRVQDEVPAGLADFRIRH
jgi:acylphosphatase